MRFRLVFALAALVARRACAQQRRRCRSGYAEKALPPTSAAASTCWPRPPPRIRRPTRRIMAEAAATKNAGAILWKIEKEGRPASYLFGTVHLTDERVTTLSPAVKAGARRRQDRRARSFRPVGERHRLGHRPVGAAGHVHRRAPARHPALQHRVRRGQIDHRPLRHAGRSGRGVQAVDRHHDPVGVGLRAHQGAEGRPRPRHEDRRDRQGARARGRRPGDHPGAARGARRRARAAADRHAARQPEVRRPHRRHDGDAGAALSQPQDHRGDALPDRAGARRPASPTRRSSASRRSCSSSAT